MNRKEIKKFVNDHHLHRYAGVGYVVATLIYLLWLYMRIDLGNWFVSVPFFISQAFLFILVAVSVRNHWTLNFRIKRPVVPEKPPTVSVVVPTYGEPVEIIERTLKSILHLNYEGKIIILLTNDDSREDQRRDVEKMFSKLARYWKDRVAGKEVGKKELYLRHSYPHGEAKAGNLNQALAFLRKHFPEVDIIYTQDADDAVKPDYVKATIGYFSDSKVAFVQTIKRSKVSHGDPFGNQDMMWYGRTAAARDADNAMYACGSGVSWRISAVRGIGGYSAWNLVEDLTTSYELLSNGWKSVYHYEAFSTGLAPEDLANFIKQRGTWAIDTMRLFFFKNPLFRKGLTLSQKSNFLETPLFYLSGFATITLVLVTSVSLLFNTWPTTASALEHAYFLLPSFLALEAYFLLLGDKIFFRRDRQFWNGMAPVFVVSSLKALIYGPNKKPRYIVTRKTDKYDNYISLVWPQVLLLGLIILSLVKIIVTTPLYSAFDWAVVFWGLYQASFFFQVIRVSLWNYTPSLEYSFKLEPLFAIRDGVLRIVSSAAQKPQVALAKASKLFGFLSV